MTTSERKTQHKESKNLSTLPNTNIQILAGVSKLDFFDSQSVQLAESISPIDAWGVMMSQPMPLLNLAFRARDAISSRFGVKKIGGFSTTASTATSATVKPGDMLDFFLVEYASEDVLSLSERDSHLDVLTCISRVDKKLTITSSVITHNAFGRIYMLPVAPAHKLIVRSFLRRIKKYVAEQSN